MPLSTGRTPGFAWTDSLKVFLTRDGSSPRFPAPWHEESAPRSRAGCARRGSCPAVWSGVDLRAINLGREAVAALASLTKPLARRNILLSVWHGAHAMCPRRERYASARRRELCVTPHGASESATSLFTPFTSPIEKNTTSVVSAEDASCLATAIITKREIDSRLGQGLASDGRSDSSPTSSI